MIVLRSQQTVTDYCGLNEHVILYCDFRKSVDLFRHAPGEDMSRHLWTVSKCSLERTEAVICEQ